MDILSITQAYANVSVVYSIFFAIKTAQVSHTQTRHNSRWKLKQISNRAPLSWQVKDHPFWSFQNSLSITCQRRVALWLL